MPFVSLHGRAFGFDTETGAIIRNGVEGGAGDQTVSAASTATTIAARGVTTLGATAAKDYTMSAPIAGVDKKLYATSGTTQTVTLAAGTFRTTAGSSFNKATFDSAGEALLLTGLSTALYGVFGNVNSVAFTTA
jgi:hypothetical protein